MKRTISTDDAPAAVGAYSQATTNGELLFTAGQIPLTPDDELLIADFGNHRVRRLDLAIGLISTVAGNGQTSGDGAIDSPTGVRFRPNGNFLVAGWGANRVFEFDPTGGLVQMLGTGADACRTEVEAPADAMTAFVAPRSVAALADGSLLVSEQGCHRITRVTNDAIFNYAGDGEPGYAGDDGFAAMARMHAGDVADGPSLGMTLSPEDPPDELYVADTANHVIRQVRVFTLQMETFAGTGEPGFVDGPPSVAQFNNPTHVFTSRDHSLWVVDAGNHAIRHIDPLGTRVTTVIGTGAAGYNGDDLPPEETQLNNPAAVWVTPTELVFVADAGNHRIRLFQNQ